MGRLEPGAPGDRARDVDRHEQARAIIAASFGVERKQGKVWDQASAFFFDQSHIGPFLFENWMVVLGLPACILFLWVLQRRTRL